MFDLTKASIRGLKYDFKKKRYFEGVWEFLCDVFYNNVTTTLLILRTNINNFFFWGWKMRCDRDWDYCFLYRVINIKMDKMHKNMTKYGYAVDSSITSKNMKRLKEVSELAKILQYDNKYGNRTSSNAIGFIKRYTDGRKSLMDDIMKKDNKYRKKLPKKLYDFYYKKAVERDEANKKEVKDRFFYLMSKYIENWWD